MMSCEDQTTKPGASEDELDDDEELDEAVSTRKMRGATRKKRSRCGP